MFSSPCFSSPCFSSAGCCIVAFLLPYSPSTILSSAVVAVHCFTTVVLSLSYGMMAYSYAKTNLESIREWVVDHKLRAVVVWMQREHFKKGKSEQFHQILEEGSSPEIDEYFADVRYERIAILNALGADLL